MLEVINFFKKIWSLVDKIHPETRTMIIVLLLGYILYTQITGETYRQIIERAQQEELITKKAEQYSLETAVEINNQVQLILEKDKEAFDVLLLNYHNNTQSLQGYKYLYLSCLTEAPRSLDTPTLKQQWNKIDYVYYADELAKIHGESFVQFNDLEKMKIKLPKLYRLVKASDAQAVSFFTIEGHDSQIGLVVLLYNEGEKYDYSYAKKILPCIQKLAVLLDYNGTQK